jgi:hypothetical protein
MHTMCLMSCLNEVLKLINDSALLSSTVIFFFFFFFFLRCFGTNLIGLVSCLSQEDENMNKIHLKDR